MADLEKHETIIDDKGYFWFYSQEERRVILVRENIYRRNLYSSCSSNKTYTSEEGFILCPIHFDKSILTPYKEIIK